MKWPIFTHMSIKLTPKLIWVTFENLWVNFWPAASKHSGNLQLELIGPSQETKLEVDCVTE